MLQDEGGFLGWRREGGFFFYECREKATERGSGSEYWERAELRVKLGLTARHLASSFPESHERVVSPLLLVQRVAASM